MRNIFEKGTEFLQFFIALALILAFVILLWDHFPTDEKVAQGIFTGFIAWIGTIVGFYFGQKPVKYLTQELETKSSKIGLEKTRTYTSINQANKLIETLESLLENVEE